MKRSILEKAIILGLALSVSSVTSASAEEIYDNHTVLNNGGTEKTLKADKIIFENGEISGGGLVEYAVSVENQGSKLVLNPISNNFTVEANKDNINGKLSDNTNSIRKGGIKVVNDGEIVSDFKGSIDVNFNTSGTDFYEIQAAENGKVNLNSNDVRVNILSKERSATVSEISGIKVQDKGKVNINGSVSAVMAAEKMPNEISSFKISQFYGLNNKSAILNINTDNPNPEENTENVDVQMNLINTPTEKISAVHSTGEEAQTNIITKNNLTINMNAVNSPTTVYYGIENSNKSSMNVETNGNLIVNMAEEQSPTVISAGIINKNRSILDIVTHGDINVKRQIKESPDIQSKNYYGIRNDNAVTTVRTDNVKDNDGGDINLKMQADNAKLDLFFGISNFNNDENIETKMNIATQGDINVDMTATGQKATDFD